MSDIKQFLVLFVSVSCVSSSRVHNIYWNTTNDLFKVKNPAATVVNEGNLPWEYDQVNIICPTLKAGSDKSEQHVIYSVEKQEYENCRVSNPRPKIVAICNRPESFMYFTITFRSFTPTPGGLEFHPGQDYYFISTSNQNDIHRRVGGWCSSHNMKMAFRVADNKEEGEDMDHASSSTIAPIPTPAAFWSKYWQNARVPDSRENYIYQRSQLENLRDSQNTIEGSSDIYQGHVDMSNSRRDSVIYRSLMQRTSRRDKSVDIRITSNSPRSTSSGSFVSSAYISLLISAVLSLALSWS